MDNFILPSNFAHSVVRRDSRDPLTNIENTFLKSQTDSKC